MAARPGRWAKFVDLVKHVWPVVAIATFGGLAYNMRVMRGNLLDTLNAQYVETARAKGLTESAVDHAPRRAQRAASAGHVPGRGAALHADRRDRDGDHLRAADRRPGDRRLDGGRRRLCHRHLHDGAVGDADRRQHHRRHAARPARPARPPVCGGAEMLAFDRIAATAAGRRNHRHDDTRRAATRAISRSSGAA